MSDIEDEPPPVLLPCSICSRTFRPDVLERHAKVCEKTASKKRKVFDSFKSRVTGTELEEFLGPAPLPGQAPKRIEKSPVKKTRGRPKWKETHENLIAVLRAARGAATGEAPPALAPKNAGNEQCPSCGRFFGPRAFDRHVQFCKEKTSRIKLTPSKVSQAQERLEARTKYKAPLSLKPKLTTKEKYSPMLSRKVESSDTNSISSNTKSHVLNSASKTTKPMPGKTNLSNFSRQSPTRASERQRSISPRKSAISSSRAAKEVGKSPAQPKIKDNLTATEDLRPRQNTKMTTHQDKLRGPNRKISNFEDLPKSNKKQNCREKSSIKSCMSSDEGTETDSIYSSSTCYGEKIAKKDISPGSPIKKNVRPASKEQRLSHNEGSRSSRRSKGRMPLINDLSVNDESFGIHVAPCPHRSSRQGNKSADHKRNTPRLERKEEVEKQPEQTEEVVILAVPQVRSSRIPKPVTKGGDNKKEYEARDEAEEEYPKKDRERTATIKKLHDISSMSTDELLNISDELDLISDLEDLHVKSGFETENSEIEEICNSAFLEMDGEEFVKLDDSIESKEEEISGESRNDKREDEFIILHQAEPEKFLDDDMDMKLSISEPCFKTDYPEANAVFKANPDLFVFNSPPKYFKRKSTHRKKSKTERAKKVKIIPRFLTIRERTFLADDYPKVKRLKLSGKEKLPRTKIANLNEYFFGHLPALREEHRKLIPHVPNSNSDALAKRKHTKNTEKERQKVGKVENVEKVSAVPEKQKKWKKFDYFEIGKDLDEEPESDGRKGVKESGNMVDERDGKNESSIVGQSEIRKEKISGSRGDISTIQSNNKMRKLTICYSDEEFEELRQKKEKRFNRLNLKSSHPESDDDHSTEDLPFNSSSDMNSNDGDSFPMDSEFGKMNSIAEEEEPSSSARSIEIEDFIIKKPNKSNILSKSGNCLEELFPKLPEKTETKQIESKMAIPLSYVFDSLYDLKDEGCVSSRKDNGTRLPEIQPVRIKKDKKGNSMSSLVQMWKTRKEMIENGTLYEAQMASSEKAKRQKQKQKNPFQIALLPLVLTQKLAEVAEQFDNSKSKDENYDPFKQAERQMMALLSWPSTADLKSSNENSQSPKNPNRSANLETSPTSAFSKYQSKEEQSPKEVKENVNQKKVSSARSGKRNEEHAPVYSAADDWEEIFEKHFDLNRNEMNDKMTRSVKSALDGLIKKSQKNYLGEIENSPPQRNQSELTDNSIMEEIAYTSTPKKSTQRLSNPSDGSFERSGYRKSSNSSYARVTPPDDFIDGVGREDWGRKSNRNSGVSLSSLSFCSQASDTTLADEEIMRTNLEIIGIGKSTPRTSKRRFARSQSVFDERNKMLFAKTFDNHFSSSDENEILPTIADVEGKKSVQSNPYPKSLPSRFPRSQSVMDGRCRGDGDHYEERDLVSSPEGSKNRKAKMSGDSAYSSLNRRSPRAGVQSNQQQEDRLSSSGSEHSLPRLSIEHPLKPVSLNFENTSSVSSNKEQPYKMSKFCHECGSKYPVAVAKFCCECGVRRLII